MEALYQEFQAPTKVFSKVMKNIPFAWGSMIWNITRRCPAPSIRAASTVESGTAAKALAAKIR